MARRVNFYATGEFNRAVERREDVAWIREKLADPASRLYPIWRLRNYVSDPEAPHALVLDPELRAAFIEAARNVVLLGTEQETAHFLIDISHLDEAEALALGHAVDLRAVGALMPQREGALLAYARGLTYWHDRHKFCGVCGSPTEPKSAGHQRQCTNPDCSVVQFPRTDPAVIMRITHGDKILMARQAVWPQGMHSILAGFVEPGESLEDAVAREVYEEVGLRLTRIRYFSSQPWPFPSSLMLGFSAEATSDQFKVDEDELESARWMTRQDLLNSPEDETFKLPRKDSISRRLIEDWLRLKF
ncbi:NAD(+) diphosphatase [Dongia sp.]|uniref:NAD(+) diphosphatase n=1 Tax=Dongia sp. TaxID=1977262 RepID=UPI003750E289